MGNLIKYLKKNLETGHSAVNLPLPSTQYIE